MIELAQPLEKGGRPSSSTIFFKQVDELYRYLTAVQMRQTAVCPRRGDDIISAPRGRKRAGRLPGGAATHKQQYGLSSVPAATQRRDLENVRKRINVKWVGSRQLRRRPGVIHWCAAPAPMRR